MSIEYFVEGKVIVQTKGDNISFSKGDIVYNSEKSIIQRGAETGVSYGEPRKIHPNDKPINGLEISLNLFFDGTGNNKSNTEVRKVGNNYYKKHSNKKNDSYENEFSNVARGFDATDPSAENQVTEYIEGIGTENLSSDNIVSGQGLGMGRTGVIAKVTKACMKAAAKLKRYRGKKIDLLKVNVFGFSRGAAAARHFVHLACTPPRISYSQGKNILKVFPPYHFPEAILSITDSDGTKLPFIHKYGYFGAQLINSEMSIKKIVFNFVGLYDTVASFGVRHSNDTTDLGLDAINKANFVLQLASDDEYRKNFRLTNINSTNLHGLEFTLPGVHSDIGGAYRNGWEEPENSMHRYEEKTLFKSKNRSECERFQNILIDEGWFTFEQLRIKPISKSKIPGKRHLPAYYSLIGKRILSNHYDKIPLNIMFHYSKQFGIKYLETIIKNTHNIVGTLVPIYNQLLTYTNACNQKRNDYVKGRISGNYIIDMKTINYLDFIKEEDLKKLRNEYLHWSVGYGELVNGENVSGVLPASQRKRKIQNG
ncbi:T6SS phospholipase effector Tle1-like catalytic domain-containing protein [Bergeyella zoohelcum]|uniref:Uncharacterized conserved protein n=1 Tax=Bergeyella zoohelcum TaxID=1015 RepID=A0A380ZUF0_9FLAO|nr:DUF2235 domain-containing protein [Bergeyella zoohelcum]EKB62065.1 hypothetical protein HMPREF9700_00009 [Bergeyella zoohelcum CCUG 30536]SUV52408.1 Uncharacterized conserved protein [Bergeyella zoohelcum]